MQAIDFFCGAGGLTRGFLDAGIDVRAGVDLDGRLKKTYDDNNQPSTLLVRDVDLLGAEALHREVKITENVPVLYAACTPCQPFSSLTRSSRSDERKNLLLAFARIVEEAPPDFIIVENVPGLSSSYGRGVYEEFLDVLQRLDFQWDAGKLNAADYGVPQTRKRFVLVASRHGTIRLPSPMKRKATVREHIGHFPALAHGERHPSVPNHEARQMKPHHLALIKAVPPDGGSRRDVKDESLLLPCHRGKPNAYRNVFGRTAWGSQAPTMTCRCTDVYCGRFAHPEQHRGLSLREAAALQTFPDDYVFHGTFHHIGRQIGNAVPVLLAKRLGETVLAAAQLAGFTTKA